MSETEFWSLDPGEGRAIRARLKRSETHGFNELDCQWDDQKSVTFPLTLSDVDLQNLVDLVVDHAKEHGIPIRVPTESSTPRPLK